MDRHGGLVARYVQPFGKPVTLRVAGVDMEEQAAVIVAVLKTKASFTV